MKKVVYLFPQVHSNKLQLVAVEAPGFTPLVPCNAAERNGQKHEQNGFLGGSGNVWTYAFSGLCEYNRPV